MTWAEKTLDELGHVSRGRSRHRPRDAIHLYGGTHPFFQTGDIKAAQLYLTDYTQTYSEAGLEQSKKWPAGTLCITIAANIAETAVLGIDGCFPDSVIGFIPDKNKCDVRFIKYKLEVLKRTFQQVSHGAAQDNLSQEKLLSIRFSVPDHPEQVRIAEVLSAYDDLMENNRRRMALLEESARLLYREWFVRLRFPGHEHTGIQDGVPKGWRKEPLSSLVNVVHGYAFAGEHFVDEPSSRVLMTPGNFRIGGGIKVDKLKYYSDDGPLELSHVLSPMDLTVTMTDLSKTCDTLGFPAFVPNLGGLAFLHNQRVGKVVPTGAFFPKFFLYCLLCDPAYRHHVVGAATGTSVKHTAPTRIVSYSPLLPSRHELFDAFEEYVAPLFQQINCLLAATQKLQAARDLLLPRLMSGEVTV